MHSEIVLKKCLLISEREIIKGTCSSDFFFFHAHQNWKRKKISNNSCVYNICRINSEINGSYFFYMIVLRFYSGWTSPLYMLCIEKDISSSIIRRQTAKLQFTNQTLVSDKNRSYFLRLYLIYIFLFAKTVSAAIFFKKK